jgi:hypothetical protein
MKTKPLVHWANRNTLFFMNADLDFVTMVYVNVQNKLENC